MPQQQGFLLQALQQQKPLTPAHARQAKPAANLGVPSGDAFLRGVSDYLHSHEHGSVTAQDLWAALGEAKPRSFLTAAWNTICEVSFGHAPP